MLRIRSGTVRRSMKTFAGFAGDFASGAVPLVCADLLTPSGRRAG